MKGILLLILFSFLLFSCKTSQIQTKQTNLQEYYSQKPNIENIKYLGGNGNSYEEAIIIKNANNERDGIASEYAFIEKKFGSRMADWKLINQSTSNYKGKKFDVLKIEVINTQQQHTIYFDISDFYGKF